MMAVHPDLLTPQERLEEVCEILAEGIRRVFEKKAQTERFYLDKRERQSVHVTEDTSKNGE